MRYSPAHAATSGSVPFVLRGPISIRTALAGTVVGAIGLVPVLAAASPALAVGPNTLPAQSAIEGSDLVFTLTYNGTGPATYNITVAGTGSYPAASTDFTAPVVSTVTFAGTGAAAQTITVKTTADAFYENNETLTVTATNAAVPADTVAAVGTITDDDVAPSYTLAAAPSPVAESAGSLTSTVTATLSARSGLATTIAVNTADGTAMQPGDYTAISGGTISIPAGSLTGTIPVTIVADGRKDGADPEYFTVGGVGDNVLSPKAQSVQVGITDAQSTPTLSITSTGTVGEADSPAVFTVTTDTPSELPITVTWAAVPVTPATGHGTATPDVDFTYPTTRTVTIPAGSSSATIAVALIDDGVTEVGEDYGIRLANPMNAALSSTDTAIGTIQDGHTSPTVSVTPASVTEGDSGVRTQTFTATLSGTSARTVTADWETTWSGSGPGSSLADRDYVTSSGTLVFPAGTTTQTFTIDILGDTIDEGTGETFDIHLAAPKDDTSLHMSPDATITIIDDDAAPTVTFGDLHVNEGDEASAVLLPLKLSNPSDHPITFNLDDMSPAGTASGTLSNVIGTGDYSLLNDSITIPGGRTSGYAAVLINGDLIYEPDETVKVTATSPDTAYLAAPATVTSTLTLTNDDQAPNLEINSVTGKEGDTVDVTGVVTGQSQTPTTLNVSFAGGSSHGGNAADVADFTNPGVQPVTLDPWTVPGSTVPVAALKLTDDTAPEPAETIIAGGAGLGHVGTVTEGVITIAASDGGGIMAPTMRAPHTVLGAAAVPITGVAAPHATVELWGGPMSDSSADLMKLTTAVADKDGKYSFSRWIGVGFRFQTRSNGKISAEQRVTVTQDPVFTAVSGAQGSVTLSIGGNPRGAGQPVIVQKAVSGAWVNTWRGTTGSTNKWSATVTGLKSGSTQTLRAFVGGSPADGILPGYSAAKNVTTK